MEAELTSFFLLSANLLAQERSQCFSAKAIFKYLSKLYKNTCLLTTFSSTTVNYILNIIYQFPESLFQFESITGGKEILDRNTVRKTQKWR
jgi:hypothetical protein